MTCTSGINMKLAVVEAATSDFSSGATQLIVESESLRKNETQIDLSGIKGTRSRSVEEIEEGPYDVSGSIILKPSANDFNLLLPWILGADEAATDTFAVAETLQEFCCLIDRVATISTRSTWKYEGLKVNKAILRGTKGQPVRLELQVLGKTEEADSDAFPALSLSTGEPATPYVFNECSFQYGSTAMPFSSFEITIDNALEVRRENTIVAADLCPMDRIVTARFDVPWEAGVAGEYDAAEQAGTFVMAKTNVSTSFAFGRLVQPAQSPAVGGKGRIPWNLNLEARSTGATKEIVGTNDPVV